jgi:hypothetical protein
MVTDQIVYIVVDIEADGPTPGCHAMRNLSAVATDQNGKEIGTFSVNITPPMGTSPDPDTLSWWQDHNASIWAQITKDSLPAKDAIEQFDAFVRSFLGRRIFVGHPLAFDGLWVSHYMNEVLGQGLMAFHGTANPLFFGAGIDLPSFVAGALGIDYGLCRHGLYPSVVATELPHTHHGLDDARGHADVLRKTLWVIQQTQR